MASEKLQILQHGPIRELRLNRPDVHNAFDAELIAALHDAFGAIRTEVHEGRSDDPDRIRGVLISGQGKSFCAGADLNYMKTIASFGEEENREDARRLSAMFGAIRSCPIYVLAKVHGATLGGGTGLIAACDMVIASEKARFGFTEVRLGIIPAVISPFVLERIGSARGRALVPTGERFSAREAVGFGLIDRVVPEKELDGAVDAVIESLLAAGPSAAREAKRLVDRVSKHLPLGLAAEEAGQADPTSPPNPVFEETASWIARLRGSSEGKEGMSAFLDKRPASWVRPARPVSRPK